MRKLFAPLFSILSLALILSTTGCGDDDPTFRVGDNPGTIRITAGSFLVEGKVQGFGENTVVLLTGFDDTMEIWEDENFIDSLAKEYQVVSFNRAGYGESQDGPSPRSLENITNELKAIIDATATESVILVGSEFGGAIARVFAIRFPDEVDGLLLLDPLDEGEPADLSEAQEQQLEDNALEEGAKREYDYLIENRTYLESLGNLPDLPLTVLTAQNPPTNYQNRFDLHETLGEGLSVFNFRHEVLSTAKYMHSEDPESVLTELDLLVGKLN